MQMKISLSHPDVIPMQMGISWTITNQLQVNEALIDPYGCHPHENGDLMDPYELSPCKRSLFYPQF